MAKKTGGRLANEGGMELERVVGGMLIRYGYREIDETDRQSLIRGGKKVGDIDGNWFARQIRLYENLYGARFIADFFVKGERLPDGLTIECKCQQSSGSVDEKYVFTVLSLRKMPGISVMLLDGNGPRRCAREWIASESKKSRGRFMYCENISEFGRWAREKIAN